MLQLPATLTHVQATECLQGLVQALSLQSNEALLDASELKEFDSSALAVVMELRRACQRCGKALVVHGLPPSVVELATLYGVESLLGQHA
ncbi:MAG: STAS domain-containing protein [Betaproteobacteria bacterium]